MYSGLDYKSEVVERDFLSDATLEECERLIGKTVAKIIAQEYTFTIIFTDGSSVKMTGSRWDGCSLGVEVELREANKPPQA